MRIQICGCLILLTAAHALAQDLPTPVPRPGDMAAPTTEGPFVRPSPGGPSEPVWGLKDGLRIGLWPTPGPRGLLRVYTPYLDQPKFRVINFIAVEPIVDGPRGLSELEQSTRDGRQGKWFSPSNTIEGPARNPWEAPRGELTVDSNGHQILSIYFHVEPFKNGARPIVQAKFRSDRPHEVELLTFAAPGGASMKSCILTATMGNYARLRRVFLADQVVSAKELWPDYQPEGWGFTPHVSWPATQLMHRGEHILIAATSDEADPASAAYDKSVTNGWHYVGKPATQYWTAPADPELVARVNGRATYWASSAPIPGGISFENFELEVPFASGRSFTFGVSPFTPRQLGFSHEKGDAQP